MAYLALYRLYRPRTFDEVVGQQHITRTLKNQVQTGRIGHAYLFSGARGTGKTSTAKVLARAVNCLKQKEGEPCGECDICSMSADDLSVDILEIDAASNNGVDEIRDLREKISFAPILCRYKVYIIDEVHMLSTGAFNALLKTLEEPPAHAVFILATTEMHKLPATILSRCQRFDFKRIPESIILQQLQDVAAKQGAQCEQQALQAVAYAAGGGMRDALSILDQCLGYAGDKLTYADVIGILGGAGADTAKGLADAVMSADVVSCMDIVQNVYDGGVDMAVFARELIEYFRGLMIEAAQGGLSGLPLRAVQELSRAESSMRYAPRPRVTLEAALVRLCVSGEGTDVSALLERIERLEATVESLRTNPLAAQSERGNKRQAAVEEAHPSPAAARQPAQHQEQQDAPPWQVEAADAAPQETPEKPEAPDDGRSDGMKDDIQGGDAPLEAGAPRQDEGLRIQGSHADEAGTGQKPDEQPAREASGGMDARAVFEGMLAIIRKSNPGVRPILKVAAPLAYQDGVLMLQLPPEDSVIAQALSQPNILNALNAAASEVAGQPVQVRCSVGREHTGTKDDKSQMLEQAKNVFGMDVEIID